MVRNHSDIRQFPALTNQLLNFNLTDLSNDTVIDVWLSPDSAKQVADKGHKMVLASYEYFYLVSPLDSHWYRYWLRLTRAKDCGHGEWIGKDGGGLSWCDPFKDWATVYSYVYWPRRVYDASLIFRFNPYANLTESQYPLVLGGECLDSVRCR